MTPRDDTRDDAPEMTPPDRTPAPSPPSGDDAPRPAVPDVLTVRVPLGARALVASDLHLGALSDASSEAASTELARQLETWIGAGVVVLGGDTFELWAEPNNTPAKALRAHPRFTEVVARFGRTEGRSVVVLAGNHDGALGWDDRLAGEVRDVLGAEVGRAADLEVETGSGIRRVRVEHGHQLDPHNAFQDPSRPGDRPLGQHVVTAVLPGLGASGGDDRWLDGVDGLADPADFPRFVSSRLFYRRVTRHLRWLAVPIVAVALLRAAAWLLGLMGVAGTTGGLTVARLAGTAPFFLGGILADLFLVALGASLVTHRTLQALSSVAVGTGADPTTADRSDRNEAARRRAVQLQAGPNDSPDDRPEGGPRDGLDAGRVAGPDVAGPDDGYDGYVTGHTHRPELVDLGGRFYANAGCNSPVLDERPARLGFPPVFRRVRQSGWLELEAGAELHARIWLARSPEGVPTRLERLVARPAPPAPPRPAVVASLTPHSSWPVDTTPDPGRRTRRLAAWAITAIGLINLASALTPPLGDRFRQVAMLVPWAVPAAATFSAAILAVALLVLAGGVRRGSRRAWATTLVVLGASIVANVVKGLDVEEAAVSLLVFGYLAVNGSSFRAGGDRLSTRRALVILGAVAGFAAGAAVLVAYAEHLSVLAVTDNMAARLLGLGGEPLPGRLQLLSAAITALGVASVSMAVWLLLRPRTTAPRNDDRDDRAWSLVRRYGGGTLDYFALRDDKARFVWRDTVVAYAIRGGVAVVSPDPIGPPDERVGALSAFRRHAADNGWSIAVLGAAEGWLPIYRAAGMTAIYAGDEAVVDLPDFNLEGGRRKGLRQAVNRVRKAGYRVEVLAAADVGEDLRRQLTAMAGESRRGDVERGFSMTLSRLCDPRDTDLLVAVAYGPDDRVAAFCQYVPARAINGYSLDLMRRSAAGQPNGLSDFVIVSTIEHLRDAGCGGLGLNFAAMRAVLAGEVRDSWLNRSQRAVLARLGREMQIESLWRFNAKYDPRWTPRYVVVDGADRLLSAGMAVASAESLWELPLIGRFLRNSRCPRALADAVPADCATEAARTGSPTAPPSGSSTTSASDGTVVGAPAKRRSGPRPDGGPAGTPAPAQGRKVRPDGPTGPEAIVR